MVPGIDKNPSFNVLHLDPETMLPQDYYVHSFNLTEANMTPEKNPDWKVWRDYRKDYNMTDLSPKSFLQ